MEFRNLFIANPAKLSIKQGQLAISQQQEVTVPVEDIASVLIESPQVTITAGALSTLSRQGVTVFFVDEKHLPCAQLLPMNQFSRQRKLLETQFSIGKPLQKQLWQAIVRQKIRNQGKCLELLGLEGSRTLYEMATSVQSGDPGNVEAIAAAFYFRHLFGDGFTRGQDSLINARLNYGFAIFRGMLARNLVIHGFEPCLGLHHHSELNQFNLADDLIEPYRPLVELFVASAPCPGEDLTPQMKQQMFHLTNYLVFQEQQRLRVMISMGRCVESLSSSLAKKQNCLELPELLPLEQYRYA